jgi:hypothetical protein
MAAALRRAWTRYEHLNTSRPIAVRGGIGVGLFFAGDVLAQRVAYDQRQRQRQQSDSAAAKFTREQWDSARSLRTCTWRAFVWAPTAHYFWHGLETYVSPRVVHLGPWAVAVKIVIDFATVSPPLIYSVRPSLHQYWHSR